MAAYATIEVIAIPPSAQEGSIVEVQVTVKNIGDYGALAVTGKLVVDTSEVLLPFYPDYEWLASNQSKIFTSSFTMPYGGDAYVYFWSWHYDAGLAQWIQDEYKSAIVSLGEPVGAAELKDLSGVFT